MEDLSPQAAALVAAARASGRPNAHRLTPDEARRRFEADMAGYGQGPDGVSVSDTSLGGEPDVPVRLYRPRRGRLPAIVYLHGGGWVIGSVRSHDALCRTLALAAGGVVVSVDYRRAPEHRFPAAVDDAVAATRWVAAEARRLDVDGERLAIAGDSAGGNLALAAALVARDAGGPRLRLQVLAYPVATTDLDLFDPAYDGVLLERDELRWHQDQYVPDAADRRSPLVSPLDCADLAGLPPAIVVTAGCDPLRPQGEALVAALEAAGVPVEHHAYPGQVHGFFTLPHVLDDGCDAVRRVGGALRAALAA